MKYVVKNRKNKALKIISLISLIVEAVFTVLFGILIIDFNILPWWTIAVALVFLVGLLFLFYFLHGKSQIKKTIKIVLIVISVIISAFLAFGSFLIIRTNIALDTVTGDAYSIHIYKVVVPIDDKAESLTEACDYTFGIYKNEKKTEANAELDEALEQAENIAGKELKTKEFSKLSEMLNAFYDDEVDGLFYEGSYGGMFSDLQESYVEDIKVIEEIKIKYLEEKNTETEEETTTEIVTETETSKVLEEETTTEAEKINIDPFVVYLSGNDEYDEVSITGRSDVNMLAVVNFDTRQVLLVSIPRDYYVPIIGVGGDSYDKLTHAGIYGIETSMATLGTLFGVNVDYYARVNFTSVCEIIDAIGGLAFYNPYYFETTYYDYVFPEGEVWLDGFQALQYMRERQSLEEGDIARGEHQQIVLEAMIKKLVSANSIANYDALMSAIERCAITNISSDTIKLIVKKQLQEGGDWDIVKVQVKGYGDFQPCYAADGEELSVVIPYQDTVDDAAIKIHKVLNGERVTEEETTVETIDESVGEDIIEENDGYVEISDDGSYN